MAAHWLVFVIDIRCCFASRPETPEGCPLLWSRQIPHDRQAPAGETHVRQATSRSHGCVWVQRLPAIGVFFQSATDAVGQQVAARGEAASAPLRRRRCPVRYIGGELSIAGCAAQSEYRGLDSVSVELPNSRSLDSRIGGRLADAAGPERAHRPLRHSETHAQPPFQIATAGFRHCPDRRLEPTGFPQV
jgi:hypothetical protein